MAKRRKPNAKALKHALTRANPHFLVAALMVFQVTAMLLLAFKTDTVDWQAIAFAVAMPLVSQLVLRIFVRLWPVDRTLMVLILFLCSVSLVTLKDIARSPVTPGEQGVFMLLGFVVMGFGIAVARLNIDWRKGCVALMCLAVPVILSPFVPGLGNRQYGALNWIHARQPSRHQARDFGAGVCSGAVRRAADSERPWRVADLFFDDGSHVLCGHFALGPFFGGIGRGRRLRGDRL